MTNNTNISPALQRIIVEDAVGQLRRRDGRMATQGSENGELKLDWVEGVARLLADPEMLEEVEVEAQYLWKRGIRHIIWAGMGGSVLTVRVLTRLGFCSASSHEAAPSAASGQITIYPLDSTDPAALNAIMRQVAGAKELQIPPQNQALDPSFLRSLLGDVLMIGVSMGMTSEEPITHLAWFADLLAQAQLPQAEHLMVMTLPGSYLDQFAQQRRAPSRPLQPDRGTGTGGRMSAPATRVFLLPAALAFAHKPHSPGRLRAILSQAWELYNLELASARPAEHPFVRLAAAMSDASLDGVCPLLVDMPPGWDALVPWLEQLMEESLGKGGKGVVVFGNQSIPVHSRGGGGVDAGRGPLRSPSSLTVRVATDSNSALPVQQNGPFFMLSQPYLAATDAGERLAALAASFMGWQLSMALFGYLHDITFAGQPAVENYKARARVLRMQENPLSILEQWGAQCSEGILTLYGPPGTISQARGNSRHSIADSFARMLKEANTEQRLAYLDGTINGEASPAFIAMFGQYLRRIGNQSLELPVKLRRAPADYHSTEQSEMDGPPSLVSLRLLARRHERCMVGHYDDTFLLAQAVSTWQAMLEQGRSCFLLVVDGALEDAMESLTQLFERVVSVLES
jgi:glucose-6-phosphate isomerase